MMDDYLALHERLLKLGKKLMEAHEREIQREKQLEVILDEIAKVDPELQKEILAKLKEVRDGEGPESST